MASFIICSTLFNTLTIFICLTLVITLSSTVVDSQNDELTVDFYKDTCPNAERIINHVVAETLVTNPGLGAGLIRLHFHDCFVRGCDASVLLDLNGRSRRTEKDNFNNRGLRGFEVIDEAKSRLEKECPMTVSCADILAYAARDAAKILGDINYKVPGGRRDGIVSNFTEAIGLPQASSNVSTLIENFRNKGLTVKELVVLSGAHSIGWSPCAAFKHRLYNFSETHSTDPSMDPRFADGLRIICPPDESSRKVPMDFTSPLKLDSAYYTGIRQHRVLLASDQTLLDSEYTKQLVNYYAAHGGTWKKDFVNAMIRMGSIQVKLGEKGQIRRNCRVVNDDSKI